MRLNNKALALGGLSSFLVLASCGGRANTPLLPDPVYGDAPPSGYPQTYPQSDAPAPARVNPPAPLTRDELSDGPPPSAGPSATSDRGADRYDEVGYATWYGAELAGNRTASGAPFDPAAFTAAHRTLPLGSYVEVTALDTGRTILVQINDRGPQQSNLLIDLSQAAAQSLGIAGRAAVRVRRVTPSPGDQVALRAGQPGSPRLDTPASLLAGLRQRLPGPAGPSIPIRRPIPRVAPVPQTAAPRPKSAPAAPPTVTGTYFVQVAAFGSKDRATALARSLGGSVSATGSLWRVRTGPYATAKQAAQARDAAAARGYGDARVVRED
ncbi:MAG: septal ring lytic transglycosylase RlpA family protein [Pseudomonadota bacterium]